jgi:LmbE family N-acetylglucosaminyl deacetylase
MTEKNTILVLAPHTDDGELGCGASIAKYLSEGKKVVYAAFSTCSEALPAALLPDTLVHECKKATSALGIQENDLLMYDFAVRKLLFHRQEILEELLLLNKKFAPALVLLPAQNDIHQDHQVIYAEGLRAFKNSNVLGYELPWNNWRFNPVFFEHLTEAQLQVKVSALGHYHSQASKNYMNETFIRALAQVRGVQSNAALAEAFEVYRWTR